jgi:hypothetical protein
VFPQQVDSVVGDGETATLTVYRHGLVAGDKVYLSSPYGGTDLDLAPATVLATGLSVDEFQITVDGVTVESSVCPDLTIRKVLTHVGRTRGERETFVPWRPLADVVSLSTLNYAGEWVESTATTYTIAGGVDGGLSLTGEVALLSGTLPCGLNGERWHPKGVKVEYVAGEAVLPPRAEYFLSKAISSVYARLTASGLQSEGIDYYSYSRQSSSEVGKLFGEADAILRQLRITV